MAVSKQKRRTETLQERTGRKAAPRDAAGGDIAYSHANTVHSVRVGLEMHPAVQALRAAWVGTG